MFNLLDTQINMYSIDTGHFYSNHEKYLHDMNCKYRRERNYINNKLPELEKKLEEFGYSSEDIKLFKADKSEEVEKDILEDHIDTIQEYTNWNNLIKHKREKGE